MSRLILPLPSSTTSLLRSTLIIPSLNSILIELVQNSLDAQSINITVTFNLDNWTIKCEDDGWGLTLHEMKKVGKERYLTSKLDENDKLMERVNTFGFRGEALASLADVGLLEILSRSIRTTSDDEGIESILGGESYSLVFRGRESLYNGIAKLKRNTIGTTVWVRDIFYKWPVRRKPLSSPSSRLSTISSFRTSLATIALVHPLVSFTLIDSSTGNNTTSPTKRLLQVSRTAEDNIGRWKQLWGRAGVEKVNTFDKLENTDSDSTGKEGRFRLKGFFSLTASHNKASQFIYVNSRPLSPCHLHKLINLLFSQSSFSKHSASHLIDSFSTSPTKDTIADGTTKATRKSPKKTSERFPIFIMNLILPPRFIDVTLEPEKRQIEFEDPERVYKLVEEITKTFLIRNGFSNPPKEVIPVSTGSPIKSTESQPQLSQVEAKSSPMKELAQLFTRQPNQLYAHPQMTTPPLSKFLITPILPLPPPLFTTSDPTSAPIQWIDPTTKQIFLVDPRTGNSWRPNLITEASTSTFGHENCCGGKEKERGRSTLVDRSRLRKRNREDYDENLDIEVKDVEIIESKEQSVETNAGILPDWMVKTFENWENPIFESCSPQIPILNSVSIETSGLPSSKRHTSSFLSSNNSNHFSQIKIQSFFQKSLASTSTQGVISNEVRGLGQKFTREDLKTGEFLAQVDGKFLLIRIKSRGDGDISKETLIMVDQHAASERIRVERYLSDYCGSVANGGEEGANQVKIFTFDPPKKLLLSREEVIQLKENGGREECKKWGIGIEFLSQEQEGLPEALMNVDDEVEKTEEGHYIQVNLISIPLIVSDRLKLEPKLLQELVRSFLAQLIDENGKGRKSFNGKGEGEKNWTSIMRSCPLVLLDLINSKACRGAIMFNDILTPLQCQTLLSQLADTIYPFQCAHGRPSLVPLINLADSRSQNRKIDWSRLEM